MHKYFIIIILLLTYSIHADISDNLRNRAIDAFNNMDYSNSQALFLSIQKKTNTDEKYLDFIELELTKTNKNIMKLVKSEKSLRRSNSPKLALVARYYTLNNKLDRANEIYNFLSENKKMSAHALYFLAKNLQQQGIEDDAEEIWQSIPKLYPTSPFAEASKFELLDLSLNQIELEQELVKLYQLTTNIALKRKIIGKLSSIYMVNYKVKELESIYKNYTIYIFDKTSIAYNIALLYKKHKDDANYLRYLEECQNLQDENHRQLALYELALYYFNKNELITALPYLSKESFTNNSLLLAKIALETNIYNKLNKFESTVNIASSVLNESVFNDETGRYLSYIILQRAIAYSKIGDGTNSLNDFTNIIKNNANSDLAFESAYRTGMLYASRGEYARSDKFFKYLERKKNISELEQQIINLTKAISYYYATKYRASIDLCISIIKSDILKNTKEIYTLLAANYGRIDDASTAAKIYASLLYPSDKLKQSNTYYLAAINYFKTQDYTKAIAMYDKVLTLKQEEDSGQSVLFWLGKSYGNLGEYEKASSCYEKALSIKNTEPTTQRLRSSVNLETILFESILSHYKSGSSLGKLRLAELNAINSDLAKNVRYIITEETINNGKDLSDELKISGEVAKDFDTKYKQALLLEMSEKNDESYKAYKAMFLATNQATEQLILSRKLAKIANSDQLFELIEISEKKRYPVASRMPLMLSWVINDPDEDSTTKLVYLEEIDISQLEQLEQANYCYAMGLMQFKLLQYKEAMAYYQDGLALAIAPSQYVFIREGISQIYLKDKLFADAIKEYFKIADSFKKEELIASTALYKAYKICSDNNLTDQAKAIAKKLEAEYPNSEALKKIKK